MLKNIRHLQNEITFEEASGAGVQDFRGRPVGLAPPGMAGKKPIARLAMPAQQQRLSQNLHHSGSRLSRVRVSVQKPTNRPSSQARTSVVLQKQRFTFLDNVTEHTPTDVAVKIMKAMKFYSADAELQAQGFVRIRR